MLARFGVWVNRSEGLASTIRNSLVASGVSSMWTVAQIKWLYLDYEKETCLWGEDIGANLGSLIGRQ